MKKFFILAFLMFSVSAFAQLIEAECEGKHSGKEVFFEIEQPWPTGSTFRNATLTVNENGQVSEYRYSIYTLRRNSSYELRYFGGGVRLTVDHWPDMNGPRWARSYQSRFSSRDLNNKEITLTCRYPWAGL